MNLLCANITTKYPELPPLNVKETIEKLFLDEFIDNKIKNVLGE